MAAHKRDEPNSSSSRVKRTTFGNLARLRDCDDNAMAESFFATLECELLARRRFRSHAEARMRSSTSSKAGTIRAGVTPVSVAFHPSDTNRNTKRNQWQPNYDLSAKEG
jgi:hypothetical protein